LSWEERNPDLLERIRAYVQAFETSRPTLFEHFLGGSDPVFPLEVRSDRGIGMLLFLSSLYQNIGEGRLVRFMAYLWKHYDKDLFRINRLPFTELQAKVQALTDLDDWPLWTKAPGILRSVADFFFRHGKPLEWARQVADGERCIDILSEEIFLMGRTSVFRSKARYFLWMLTQLPDSRPAEFWTPGTRMTLTLGHSRFLWEFGPLKGRKAAPWTTPAEKLDAFNRFYRLLFPHSPWMVFTPLDAYLRPPPGYRHGPGVGEPEWLCRKHLQGCQNCPLAPLCPGRNV
jgi:hypothetical protein